MTLLRLEAALQQRQLTLFASIAHAAGAADCPVAPKLTQALQGIAAASTAP
jgi:hypothetical protein